MPANRSSSGDRGLDVADHQLEVLRGPHARLDLVRDREPRPVRVDLRGVRHQRLVAHPEVVRARHLRGDPGVPLRLGLPLLEPLGVGRLEPVPQHLVVQRLGPGTVEAVVVVELERLPRIPQLGVAVGVTGRLERRHGHLVAHDVVGVGVASALVVRRHDVGPEAAHQPHERGGRLLDRERREAPLRERRLGVALGPPGVDEPEPVLPDAEDVAGPLHLLAAHLGDVGLDVGAFHLRVEDRPALPARAGDDVDVDALGDVHRGGGGALAGLVVGVGVHVHQAVARTRAIGGVSDGRGCCGMARV